MLEVIDKGACSESHPAPLLFVHGAWHAAWCWDENFLGFFADHTILSPQARAGYYDRWEEAAERTGAPWLDFRAEDEDPWFVTDTGGHWSPRGWIFADRALDMFWHDRPLDEIRTALERLATDVPSPTVLGERGHDPDATR